MAGPQEVRMGIALANEKNGFAIASIANASRQFADARNGLTLAVQNRADSTAEIDKAKNFLTEAIETLKTATAAVQASINSSQGYADRL